MMLLHNDDLVPMHLLGQRRAGQRNAQHVGQYFVILTYMSGIIAPVEAEIQAFAVACAHAARLGREGMANRQAVTGIVCHSAALAAAHGFVHLGIPPKSIEYYYTTSAYVSTSGAKVFVSVYEIQSKIPGSP